jgi:drug/metabolite transporter (DMT)-like permease
VRLDFERHGRPVAEVENAGVLARPLQDALARRGQPLQERRRMLVAAVLGPEQGEDRELEMVRIAAEEFADTVRFPVGQTEDAVEGLLGGQLRQVIQCNQGRGGISQDRGAFRFTMWMRRPIVILTVLALIWGASFMLIKIADRELTPATLILGRLASATLLLAAIAVVRLGPRETLDQVRRAWRWLVLVGLVNTLIPFWLLSWGETRIDSGLASIIQGAVPIFNALLAFAFFRESRVSGLRLVGLAIGFVGVALLVGEQPQGKLLAALAVVAMALCYAIGTLIAGRHLRDTPPLVVALASTTVSTLAVLPVGVIQAPSGMWHGETIMAILVLGLVGTAIAYLLFFALIQQAGPNYATLVTYLVPPIALAYGAIFLGESFGLSAFLALALVLVGVALATGSVTRLLVGAGARRAKPGEPAPDPL